MSIKRAMVKKILETLGQSTELEQLNQYNQKIWMNPRETGGFRLTLVGHDIFKNQLNVSSYRLKLDSENTQTLAMLLNLDRYLPCPYFIVNKHNLEIFGEREAILFALHGNNLSRLLETCRLEKTS
jgi:hypothetical protein